MLLRRLWRASSLRRRVSTQCAVGAGRWLASLRISSRWRHEPLREVPDCVQLSWLDRSVVTGLSLITASTWPNKAGAAVTGGCGIHLAQTRATFAISIYLLRSQPAAVAAKVRRDSTAADGSSARKTAEPATKMSAPASAHRTMVSPETPPST